MATVHRRARSCALVLVAGTVAAAPATAQLRIATWNLTNYQGQADRDAAIQTAVFGVYQGRSMSPDVILLQEFTNAAALSRFVSLMNAVTGPNTWGAATFINGPDTDGVCVYRRSKVQLIGTTIAAFSTGTTSDQPRHTYRYDIRPVGYTSAGATIGCYNVHMKSGSSSDDNARRLIETTRIRSNAEGQDTNGEGSGLPAGYQFLVAGDFNVQTASQSGYVKLVGSEANNSGRFFDPIRSGNNGSGAGNNGSWNNSSTYRFIHTQDPTGAGGMDDRLDIILLSAGLIDGQGFNYIGNPNLTYSQSTWNDPNHSYRAWGNDGSSFDAQLTTTGNTMVGEVIAQALKTCATTAGGHLPVFLDLRVPPKVSAPTVVDFGSVAQGLTAQQSVPIGNAGDVALWTSAGIANVSYTLSASAGFTAPMGSFIDAPGGGLNNHTITMNTSTPGAKSGTVTITSNAPDEPIRVILLTGFVVPPNQPPTADAGPDFAVTDSDGSGDEVVILDGSGSYDPDGTIVLYRWTRGATQLASGPSPTSSVTLAVGVHTIQLMVTDNGNATATDTVVVTVHPRPNQPPIADAGPDRSAVDVDGDGFESIGLDGTESADPDGSIVSWVWSTPDLGQIASGEAPMVSLPLGEHTVTLLVTDDNGATDTDTMTVTITPCYADYNRDGGIDGADVDAFFADWEFGAPGADINADGGIDGADVEAFFLRWEAGVC